MAAHHTRTNQVQFLIGLGYDSVCRAALSDEHEVPLPFRGEAQSLFHQDLAAADEITLLKHVGITFRVTEDHQLHP